MKRRTDAAVTAAQRSTMALAYIPRKTSRTTDVDVECDPDTGEILKTYDPETGEILLDFTPGSTPSILEQKYGGVFFIGDGGMQFKYANDDATRLRAAEKLVACAIVRDLAELECHNLFLRKGVAVSRSNVPVRDRNGMLMPLSRVVGDIRRHIKPPVSGLRWPLKVLSETIRTDGTPEWKIMDTADALKWQLSEVVLMLNRHSAFIHRVGQQLADTGIIWEFQIESLLREEMQAARAKNPEVLPDWREEALEKETEKTVRMVRARRAGKQHQPSINSNN